MFACRILFSFISFLHNVILTKAVSAQPRVVAYCSMGGRMYIVCEMQEYFKLEFVLKMGFLIYWKLFYTNVFMVKAVIYLSIYSSLPRALHFCLLRAEKISCPGLEGSARCHQRGNSILLLQERHLLVAILLPWLVTVWLSCAGPIPFWLWCSADREHTLFEKS